MYQQSGIEAIHPYAVNFITFSGHGMQFNGDDIGIIPVFNSQTNEFVGKFINFSKYARYLAHKKNTLNIFILSMCRNKVEYKDN